MMERIRKYAETFRKAIEIALKLGELESDFMFRDFPRGCCGDCSYLLAEFLIANGIETNYVCGEYREDNSYKMQSHAWLTTDGGVLVDITGDQFKDDAKFLNYDTPVYVGECDQFHKLFIVDEHDVHKSYRLAELNALCLPRLYTLYEKIVKYI